MSKHYPDVDPNPDFPKLEEQILAFWKQDGAFRKSVEQRAGDEFIFYDGPPFANGLPHYGHLLTGFVKDAIARYQTMRGHRVERRFGWDCHGLPAEMGSEKELGISGRAAIEHFGIGKFNEHCRKSVMKYTHEWEYYVTRQARWVDFKNDYKTMDRDYMESVLWAFKQLWEKGLIYEAYRVMPYSWAAETPLSNFETKLDNSYREREDKAVTVAFELNTPPHGAPKAEKYYVLAWTTTPWTLPSNLALAVNREIKYYTIFNRDGDCYFVSESKRGEYSDHLAKYLGAIGNNPITEHDLIWLCLGKDLIGLSYHPLFPYFANHPHSFRILDGSEFVTDADGTGIVHMAPGFGEDDQRVCEKNSIEIVVPVDGQGKFTDAIYDLPDLQMKGLNVICENVEKFKFGEANERIIAWLKAHGHLIKQETITHNYPHCWRTDQPLIYRALPSWYVEVTKFRDRAVEINKTIHWIPEHIRDGQMGHMLATAPDWSISRNRFWGTPIPVWRSKSGQVRVFGSIAELEKASGKKIDDLHRPFIDDIVITEGGEEFRRVSDVFDCWFESGSMPFAQVHYPFENKEWFEQHFPADFITEYVGQTRGWFNTLIMLSTALFDRAPFKHCICHGVVLDSETGLKYSKRLKNYKDPREVMDAFGADALRWMMLSSPVMRGMDISVDPEGRFIRDVVRLAIKPVWNAYNFFCLYANADGIKASSCGMPQASAQDPAQSLRASQDDMNVMDRYILAKCRQAVEAVRAALDAYDTPTACEAVTAFFEALNNWYIRRNKERFWKEEKDADKQAAYDTLFTVLTTMCRAVAPLLPLTAEAIYKGLTDEESVHLADFPNVMPAKAGIQADSDEIVRQMDWVRDVCNTALAIRNKVNIRVRQPLHSLTLAGTLHIHDDRWMQSLKAIIQDEVNVKELEFSGSFAKYATQKVSIISAVLGKRLPDKMKQIIPASKKGEWKESSLLATIEICDEKIFPGEYTLQLEPKPEYKDRAQALSTNDALVILDTNLSEELIAEGLARDVVRLIQQTRKDAGLHVSDRIALSLAAPPAIARAVQAHEHYIKEQTLAASLTLGEAKGAFVAEHAVEQANITIALSKAA